MRTAVKIGLIPFLILWLFACRKNQNPGWDCPGEFTLSSFNLYINPYSPSTGSSIASCLPLNPFVSVSIIYRANTAYERLSDLQNPYVKITWELPGWLEITESRLNNSELVVYVSGKKGTGEVVMHVVDGCTGNKQTITIPVSIADKKVLYDVPASAKPPQNLSFAGLTNLNGLMYAASGRPQYGNDKTVFSFNPSTGKWSVIGSNPSGKRFIRPYLTNWNNLLYLFTTEETWEIAPLSNTWTALPPFPGIARQEMEAIHIGNRVYAGLGNFDNYFAYQDWWTFDLLTKQWMQLPDCPGNQKLRPAMLAINGDVMVAGLMCPLNVLNNDSTVYFYRTSSHQWELAPFLSPPIPDATCMIDSTYYLMSGRNFFRFDESINGFVNMGLPTAFSCRGWNWEYIHSGPFGYRGIAIPDGEGAIILGMEDCKYGGSTNIMRIFIP